MTPLAALALRILLVLSPLRQPRETLPGWAETPWERGARYVALADDVAGAVEDACSGRPSCERWALPVLLGIGTHESGWAPDVQAGKCYRLGGHWRRCDGGRAKGPWQVLASAKEGAAWATDVRLGAGVALRQARRSWNTCGHLEPALRWASYARGRCDDPDGQRLSRELHSAIERAMSVR